MYLRSLIDLLRGARCIDSLDLHYSAMTRGRAAIALLRRSMVRWTLCASACSPESCHSSFSSMHLRSATFCMLRDWLPCEASTNLFAGTERGSQQFITPPRSPRAAMRFSCRALLALSLAYWFASLRRFSLFSRPAPISSTGTTAHRGIRHSTTFRFRIEAFFQLSLLLLAYSAILCLLSFRALRIRFIKRTKIN